ncbi:Oidioi.mRNA.OKI2018_I69.PAR.g12206.t1.cds [Oikopleura dioica]|uniref:Oidioi.mRNA.OKI2018_I69.PAR.g12206.t1.cds n=1 Tax=Oikopleura dioica TaxID=34765 RepID=A0ABN7S3J0_OIKDI|nr:Oidioi.mRNA.OKI2018_I69.PAR.g12206.t1.cds [Oikopleura dioica]
MIKDQVKVHLKNLSLAQASQSYTSVSTLKLSWVSNVHIGPCQNYDLTAVIEDLLIPLTSNRAKRRQAKKEKQDKKSHLFGYHDMNDLVEKNNKGEISHFFQYVYGIKTTKKSTTTTTTTTTSSEKTTTIDQTTTEQTTTEQTTTSAETTTVQTTTSIDDVKTTTEDIRFLSAAEKKKRRKAQRMKAKQEREAASTSRPATTPKSKGVYSNLSDTVNEVQN